jgi:hypothetical protein
VTPVNQRIKTDTVNYMSANSHSQTFWHQTMGEIGGMTRASSGSISLARVLTLGTTFLLVLSSLMMFISIHSNEAAALAVPWGDAMEMGPGLWTNYSNGRDTEWQLGEPLNVGPNATHSGLKAWGTNIAADYSTEALAYLESPSFDLALSTNVKLVFWHYLETDGGLAHNLDGGMIEVSTDSGVTWIQIDDPAKANPNPYYDESLVDSAGNPLGGREAYCYNRTIWEEVTVDLSQFDGSSNLIFRFVFGSDTIGGSPGWYIDDVLLTADVKEGVIVEPDFSRVDLEGTTHRFDLTVRNLQRVSDVIDIVLRDEFGWATSLFKWDGVSPLDDTGGLPGIPDTGSLYKGASHDIVLQITIPSGTPYATENLIEVEGVPYSGSVASDIAYITLSTPTPDVSITDLLVPNVHVMGEEAEVIVHVRNNGQYNRSFDVMLDMSGPERLSCEPVRHVEDLGVGEMTSVSWAFTPTTYGEYTVSAMTTLDIDVVPENNASETAMTVMMKLFEDEMENGGPASLGLWTAGKQPQTAWELGIPSSVGPSSCHSPSRCWGTNLNSDYRKAADIRLETPLIDLSASDDARLRFWHFYDIRGPFGDDGGFIEISDDGGSSWTYVEPLDGYPGQLDPTAPAPLGAGAYAGTSAEWTLAEFDLGSFSGRQIIVGFHLWTDSSNYQSGWAGWYVDDVQILHLPVGPVLMFTEIQDSGPGGERIEVYNEGEVADNLSNYAISRDGGHTTIGGSWSKGRIDPGEHGFFSISGNELNDEGDMLTLVNTTSNEIEYEIGYGQYGTTPDPISGESVSRYWNGNGYEEYWARSPEGSFGAENSVQPHDVQSDVVLNEVLFNPATASEGFIEILYSGNGSIDLRNYTIVCDDNHTIESDVILDADRPHYIMLPVDFPWLFVEMDVDGDNLYLYDTDGSFVDMAGWSTQGDVGKSMARVPKGFGSRDGYDDESSTLAGWEFGKDPTMALIGIRPGQTGYGDMGDHVTYTLTVLNQPLDDLISLTFETSRPWQVYLLTASGAPLPDTNSDGIPDTGQIPASSSYDFKVKVVIPAQPPIGNEMTADIYASSTVNKARDFTTIVTKTRPYLEPMKSAYPEEINQQGVGSNEISEITLEVFGGGYMLTERQPQDTILIIDSSGSMQDSDPDDLRLEAAKEYIDNMSAPDRGAVVDFDYTAELAPRGNGDHLSSDYAKIKQNIDTIDSNGGTNVGAGIEVANNELMTNGDPSHLWVEILLSDANEPITYYPVTSMQIQNATDAGIMIFTIGLGLADEINEWLLVEIAERTGGEFYLAETPDALLEIYSKIEMVISDIAGRDGDLTDTDRMIRDVLPSYIQYVYSSFSIWPDTICTMGDITFIEWNVPRIKVGQSWKVSYQVRSSKLGWVPVGVYPDSRVSYIRWNNEHAIHPFPDVKVHVVKPPLERIIGPPENLRTSVESSQDVRLDWYPPDEPGVSHYLIYRSEDQREFDFTNPIHDTSGDVQPIRTDWLDAGAAGINSPREFYYTVRAVNVDGTVSTTSNTAGKWTRTFEAGLNNLSLPLEPFTPIKISDLTSGIPNAEFIRTIRSDGKWETHVAGIRGPLDDEAVIGRGYELYLSAQTTYTFVGFPGSMISYREGFGESLVFRKGLKANVLGDDIHITWQPAPYAIEHEVFRSTARDGLFEDTLQPIARISASTNSYLDEDVASPGTEHYYWIVPIDSLGEGGGSSYSVGVWVGTYRKGIDTISPPLQLTFQIWIDGLCDLHNDIVGMAYLTKGIWKFHAREMPPQVYDSIFQQSMGYQISSNDSISIVFIGF